MEFRDALAGPCARLAGLIAAEESFAVTFDRLVVAPDPARSRVFHRISDVPGALDEGPALTSVRRDAAAWKDALAECGHIVATLGITFLALDGRHALATARDRRMAMLRVGDGEARIAARLDGPEQDGDALLGMLADGRSVRVWCAPQGRVAGTLSASERLDIARAHEDLPDAMRAHIEAKAPRAASLGFDEAVLARCGRLLILAFREGPRFLMPAVMGPDA